MFIVLGAILHIVLNLPVKIFLCRKKHKPYLLNQQMRSLLKCLFCRTTTSLGGGGGSCHSFSIKRKKINLICVAKTDILTKDRLFEMPSLHTEDGVGM